MPNRSHGNLIRMSFGIGEWYGESFICLSAEERRNNAAIQFLPAKQRPTMPCLPRSYQGFTPDCSKEGGVCSIRSYQLDTVSGEADVLPGEDGLLCTTCPYRFYEDHRIFQWIGETIIGHPSPLIVGEVGFPEREGTGPEERKAKPGRDDVGRIDHVLVSPDAESLSWCAVEMQAVYFSGSSMKPEFQALKERMDTALPYPVGQRHPDFRSSGPKRLMPQLQIKVPTLRRWGKKMCVVIDRAFFHALGHMQSVHHVSNCDIARFVVRYDEDDAGAHLKPDFVHFTTLEHAVEGLTAGYAVSLPVFLRTAFVRNSDAYPPTSQLSDLPMSNSYFAR